MPLTSEAAQTRYEEAMAFLQRTLTFIKKNKEFLASKKEKAPLTLREIIDTIEERIETHLSEWIENNTKAEGR